MFSAERRREILNLLRYDGRVLVAELSKHFQTSQITIRKDLSFLHQDGQLERIYGGALPKEPGAAENGIETTSRRHWNQESRIVAPGVGVGVAKDEFFGYRSFGGHLILT